MGIEPSIRGDGGAFIGCCDNGKDASSKSMKKNFNSLYSLIQNNLQIGFMRTAFILAFWTELVVASNLEYIITVIV
jgi:hypothetical protein